MIELVSSYDSISLSTEIDLNPPILKIEYRIIAIDNIINIGAKVVNKMLTLRGTRNAINEKHAGHTPIMKPRSVPAIPDLVDLLDLHSIQLFLAYR
jgi:hypothetical protein